MWCKVFFKAFYTMISNTSYMCNKACMQLTQKALIYYYFPFLYYLFTCNCIQCSCCIWHKIVYTCNNYNYCIVFEIIKDSNEIDQINVCMVCARVKFQWITWIYVFKHKVYRLYQNSSIKIFQKLNLANMYEWKQAGKVCTNKESNHLFSYLRVKSSKQK